VAGQGVGHGGSRVPACAAEVDPVLATGSSLENV
jgi:hypothetical protein